MNFEQVITDHNTAWFTLECAWSWASLIDADWRQRALVSMSENKRNKNMFNWTRVLSWSIWCSVCWQLLCIVQLAVFH